MIKNIKHNNGRVGQWGISYPGFYASAGAIDSHPALKAVSPQAPIADWFFDDFHRNGAFVLPMGFNFFSSFGVSRPGPTPLRRGTIQSWYQGRLSILLGSRTFAERQQKVLQWSN
jgi:predicted acyl esterase